MSDDVLKDVTGQWDRSILPSNVVVGQDCFLESSQLFVHLESTRDRCLVIGDRVRIYLGGWGGGFAILDNGSMEIGDDTTIVGAQFMCADRIVIGHRVMISYNAIIADADFHPRDPVLRKRDAILCAPTAPDEPRDPFSTGPIIVEDDARIGINAVILKGVTIGAGASVYGGAVVTADVPAGAVVAGNPARLLSPDEYPPQLR